MRKCASTLLLCALVIGGTVPSASVVAQPIQYTSPIAAPAGQVQSPVPASTEIPFGYGYTPAPTTGAPATSVQPAEASTTEIAPAPRYFGEPQPITETATHAPLETPPSSGYSAPVPAPQVLTKPAAASPVSDASYFISGGIGKAERDRLEAVKDQYNFRMQMATSGGAFVSGVNVQIRDGKGTVVLETVTDGPLLMAKLPVGKYTVQATKFGETKTQSVQVEASGAKTVNVFWKRDA